MKVKDKREEAIGYTGRLLGVRPRSEKELRERLLGKNFGRAVIDSAVSFLKERNVIDDARFARLWIESRMNTRPSGKMLLKRELEEKGISGEIIASALRETAEKESKTARALAVDVLGKLGALPREKAKAKLFGLLARRGFDPEVIEEIIGELRPC
ncbi:MAG: recombination regulator RecX [Omnitrophica bacterium]|nr:recombination regulator RecX [Candidatus Omnitrophota bacterium]